MTTPEHNLTKNCAHEEWNRGRGRHKNTFLGLVLIGVGSIFMLKQWGYIDTAWFQGKFHWWHILLLVLVTSGLGDILTANHLRQVGKGLFHILVGFWLFACFEHLWGWTFGNSWPVLLIAIGLNVVLHGWSGRRHE